MTRYTVDGVSFEREYFISYPDSIMAIRLTSDQKGALNFKVHFQSLLKYEVTSKNNILKVEGYAPYHAEPDYRGDMPNAVLFDEDRGTRFSSYVTVKDTDGKVSIADGNISVEDASNAVLLVSIATSFNGFDKNPVTDGKDNKGIALGTD